MKLSSVMLTVFTGYHAGYDSVICRPFVFRENLKDHCEVTELNVIVKMVILLCKTFHDKSMFSWEPELFIC